MKKLSLFSAITLLLSIFGYAQNNEQRQLIEAFEFASIGKVTNKIPPQALGSPYVTKWFSPAKVNNMKKTAPMRYDACNDEFEFIDAKNDTLVLNKTADFGTILFAATNTKYQLLNYTDRKGKSANGYLVWVYETNDFTLFKKQLITLAKERVATTSFEKSSPPQFEKEKDIYFFKNGANGIVVFPSNKKGVIKLFPDKKSNIEAFIKQNDIDFDREADMIKLIDFLAK